MHARLSEIAVLIPDSRGSIITSAFLGGISHVGIGDINKLLGNSEHIRAFQGFAVLGLFLPCRVLL
jgi:hypothetical protein